MFVATAAWACVAVTTETPATTAGMLAAKIAARAAREKTFRKNMRRGTPTEADTG
ncbi:MAG: hypothetical protein KIS96_07820 [Bauldia sp.]|nr:hypothetical protein [Bauldia sp.]